VAGALIAGLIFALMWQVSAGHSQRCYFWFFLIGTNLFYAALTLYAAPFIALGYEMTADYDERTRIQGFSNFIGQIPWLLLSWSYAFMENKRLFDTNVEGARMLAIIVGVAVCVLGILPGLFCKEPFYGIAQAHHKKEIGKNKELMKGAFHHVKEFLKGFGITLKNRRFLKLAAATFLIFNGFNLIAGLGFYVIIFYIFGGDHAMGAKYVGLFGTVLSACTFGAIFIATWMATNLGKKTAFIACTSIAIAGYVLKWFCYQPDSPNLMFLPAPLIAFGLGGLFTTVSAMIADVCDQDELEVGYRREGTFGAIYWWMVKLGTAAALAASGYLLNITGFLQELGPHQSERSLFLMRVFEIGLPILTYALAIAAMATYDLNPGRVREIRLELEKQRGKAET
jgi:GPH family glycoside/pentoside/hexuronide:cation symporter